MGTALLLFGILIAVAGYTLLGVLAGGFGLALIFLR